MSLKRVVVTGVGLITPVGHTPAAVLQALYSRRSGIKVLETIDTSLSRSKIGASVDDFDPSTFLTPREVERLDRATQLALGAADQALADARLLEDGRCDGATEMGIAMGTGAGSVHALERGYYDDLIHCKPNVLAIPMGMHHAPAAHISIRYGLKGPSYTLSTACSSGAVALGLAFKEIRCGAVTQMLAGGTESCLTKVHLDNWSAMRTLSTQNEDPGRAMKPFSRNRDGFVLGEGAALLVLEELEAARARGATIYAELMGFGCSSDASHITCPSAEGQAIAISRALESAGLTPDRIDYINAHGTATPLNDRTETLAIRKVFGRRVPPVSSIKPATGHMLAASAAAEFAVAILAGREQLIPPTANYEEPDPDCDLDYVVEGPRKADLNLVMSTSFGFGGNNAVLVARCTE